MRKDLLIIALGLFLAAGSAAADVLAIPEEDPAGTPAITLPAKGSTMADVQAKYGPPRAKQPTVGGDAPKHPPITRWDYDGFVVIFENERVIDAVVPGAPPKVYHKDRLQPVAATSASPPPPAAEMPAEPMMPAEPAVPADDASMPPEAPAEATPDNPYPDRPTPAEASVEEAP